MTALKEPDWKSFCVWLAQVIAHAECPHWWNSWTENRCYPNLCGVVYFVAKQPLLTFGYNMQSEFTRLILAALRHDYTSVVCWSAAYRSIHMVHYPHNRKLIHSCLGGRCLVQTELNLQLRFHSIYANRESDGLDFIFLPPWAWWFVLKVNSSWCRSLGIFLGFFHSHLAHKVAFM